jgi:hypothetical protein
MLVENDCLNFQQDEVIDPDIVHLSGGCCSLLQEDEQK